MSGQFFVEPVPGLVVEPEDEPEEPEEPEVPVLGLEVEPEPPEPELEVVVDVVAASATNAPPTTRPEVKAPMASALRICRCMVVALSSRAAPADRAGNGHDEPSTLGRTQNAVSVRVELPCGRVTFHSTREAGAARA
jgi:hypothetical protein